MTLAVSQVDQRHLTGYGGGVPLSFDVRNFTNARREELAWLIHEKDNFALPHLSIWNYDACRIHARGWVETVVDESGNESQRTSFDPNPECHQCGIRFRQHQRVGVGWLYLKKNLLLADSMGLGKTTEIAGLIALLHDTGELSLARDRSDAHGGMGRVIIVPRAAALFQWQAELYRMMPTLNVIVSEGDKRDRTQLYLQPWQVLLIGPEMIRQDYAMLEHFDLSLLVTDDIDPLRNPETDTSYYLDRLGSRGTYGLRPSTDRYVIASGTPLQKRLPELHAILDGIGGERRLGDVKTFTRRYVRKETVSSYNSRTGREERREVVVGYKNLGILKREIAPLVLRRTAADLTDITLPTIIPNDIYLDLYPAQRRKYEELRKGVVRLIKDQGVRVKRVDALTKIHYGASICAGLVTLGEADGPGTSVKMDWVLDKLQGDLSDEKVVQFINLKDGVRAMQTRLRDAGIGFVTVWGEERDKRKRQEAQERFWHDPTCQVLIGTKAIEQSLNLQIARHLINVDTILNPARMNQLAGRIRRDGSPHAHVFVHNLMTIRTQEEKYIPMLRREQALADWVWEENNQLFEALPPLMLLQMISGD